MQLLGCMAVPHLVLGLLAPLYSVPGYTLLMARHGGHVFMCLIPARVSLVANGFSFHSHPFSYWICVLPLTFLSTPACAGYVVLSCFLLISLFKQGLQEQVYFSSPVYQLSLSWHSLVDCRV